MYEKRASLYGEVNDFSKLEHEVLHYHDTNTMVAMGLLVVSCLAYLVVTNTFLAEFIASYIALTS